jgi:hypothetical protein
LGATILGPGDERPGVVVGTAGAGKTIYVGVAYARGAQPELRAEGSSSDRLLEQSLAWLAQRDTDADNVSDVRDDAPQISNPGQEDADGDGHTDAHGGATTDTDGDSLSDAEDTGSDGDGVPDSSDNARVQANADQADADADGIGDAADDQSPPTVVSVSPSLASGTLHAGTDTLQVTFSEPVIGADAEQNYALYRLTDDGLLLTGASPIVPVNASVSGNTATLTFSGLSEDVYRLAVRDAITDASYNPLDGDDSGEAGGNYERDFVVPGPARPALGPHTNHDLGAEYSYYLTTGDFNNDAVPDVAVADLSSPYLQVALGDGAGRLLPATAVGTGGTANRVITGDFNGDGNLDLAVGYRSGLRVMLGDGAGDFSEPIVMPPTWSYYDLAAGDFDQDGNLDVVTVSGSNYLSFHRGNGDGTFATPVSFGTGGGGAVSALTADLDGDGDLEVAVSHSGNTVSVFLWRGGGHGRARGLRARPGLPVGRQRPLQPGGGRPRRRRRPRPGGAQPGQRHRGRLAKRRDGPLRPG